MAATAFCRAAFFYAPVEGGDSVSYLSIRVFWPLDVT